jgi:hypothetical protein
MNTYTSAEILRAVNAQILEEVQMGANNKQEELAADILRRFMAKLSLFNGGNGETI